MQNLLFEWMSLWRRITADEKQNKVERKIYNKYFRLAVSIDANIKKKIKIIIQSYIN